MVSGPRPHAGSSGLLARLQACHPLALPFRDVVYRATTPAYATERDLVTGDGALRVSGRWHAKGTCRVVYGSLSAETALAEALANNRYFGIPDADAMPRTIVAVDCALASVLDIALPDMEKILKLKGTALSTVNWRATDRRGLESISQAVGWAAHASNWEALLVPSAADAKGRNLVIFPDNLASASSLKPRGLGPVSPV